jgi:hypothetical protein
MFSNMHTVGVVLSQLIKLVLVLATLTVVGIAILRVGDAYPLSQFDRYTLGWSFLSGAGLAKWIRYRYWKRYT